MSDFRSQTRSPRARNRQRAVERRLGVNPLTPPWRNLGSSEDKYGRFRGRMRHLAEQLSIGELTPKAEVTLKKLPEMVSAEWLLGLNWSRRRGAENQFDVCPGPNGLRLADLEKEFGMWWVCRFLRDLLRHEPERYHPAGYRRIWVRKPGSRKLRPIDIADVTDWLIEKTVQVAIRDLLEAWLPVGVMAYRRGLGHMDAVAAALALTETRGLRWWLAADIADAYGHVRPARLRDMLRRRVQSPEVVDLVLKLMNPQRRKNSGDRGIPQGSPLSPGLFNAYAATYIDLPWQRNYPEWPMIRYADDILVLAPTRGEIRMAHRELRELLVSAGFREQEAKTTVTNIERDAVQWLGHDIRGTSTGFQIGVPERHWRHLELSLETWRSDGDRVVSEFLRYHGPAWDSQSSEAAVSRAADILVEAMPTEDVNGYAPEWMMAADLGLQDWKRIRSSWTTRLARPGRT